MPVYLIFALGIACGVILGLLAATGAVAWVLLNVDWDESTGGKKRKKHRGSVRPALTPQSYRPLTLLSAPSRFPSSPHAQRLPRPPSMVISRQPQSDPLVHVWDGPVPDLDETAPAVPGAFDQSHVHNLDGASVRALITDMTVPSPPNSSSAHTSPGPWGWGDEEAHAAPQPPVMRCANVHQLGDERRKRRPGSQQLTRAELRNLARTNRQMIESYSLDLHSNPPTAS